MGDWVLFGHGAKGTQDQKLYFVFCRELARVKLGVAKDPLARLSQLRTGSPARLEILFYTAALGATAEQSLHEILGESRVREASREWFHWNAEVQDFLQGVIYAVSGLLRVGPPFRETRPDPKTFERGATWAQAIGKLRPRPLPREDDLWRPRALAQLRPNVGSLALQLGLYLPPPAKESPAAPAVPLPPRPPLQRQALGEPERGGPFHVSGLVPEVLALVVPGAALKSS